MNKKFLCLVELFIGLAFLVGTSATAFGEEFYKGKTIRFVVGASPGGGYDTYTRTIARNIGKYIPGNPTPIVQNMTGAGMLIAAHYIYKRAKPDGLTVGVWNSAWVVKQALGESKVKFKGDKFGWIGGPGEGIAQLCHYGLYRHQDAQGCPQLQETHQDGCRPGGHDGGFTEYPKPDLRH